MPSTSRVGPSSSYTSVMPSPIDYILYLYVPNDFGVDGDVTPSNPGGDHHNTGTEEALAREVTLVVDAPRPMIILTNG